jgi:type IV pilus assembly protein PilW
MMQTRAYSLRHQTGLTLIELMVALAIGSFLIIGAIQIYNQSRQAFVVNESIARVQETAQFAMDTIPTDLTVPTPSCGDSWAFDLARPIDGSDNTYTLPCAASGGSAGSSDVITVRRASVQPVLPEAGRLQIQSTRIQGELFEMDTVPAAFQPITNHPITGVPSSGTHNLMVNSYYVSPTSTLIPGVPTLRRKTLTVRSGAPFIEDQEVAPGVNTVDRYVNPGDDVYNPAAAGYIPGVRVITARVWIIVRSVTTEFGLRDARTYQPGNANMGQMNDSFRRLQVSKTILLRNART